MADKTVADLPALQAVSDETLLPVYQPGAANPAQKMKGQIFRQWAEACVTPYSTAARADAALAEAARNDAQNASTAAQSALTGVQTAIKNIPKGSTPIVNDLTTGGVTMALSAEQGKVLGSSVDDRMALGGRTLIKDCSLNDQKTLGNYYGTFNNVTDGPEGVTGSFYLYVKDQYNSGAYIEQELVVGASFVKYHRRWNGTTWSEWSDLYVRVSGSNVMTGNLFVFKENPTVGLKHTGNGCGTHLVAANHEARLQITNVYGDSTNRRYLQLFDSGGKSSVAEAVYLVDVVNGTAKGYAVLHTGNKPNGSYTGNGSAASRTIDVGGIVGRYAVLITSEKGGAIVTSGTTIGWSTSGGAVAIPYGQAHYISDLKLSLATTNELLNANGVKYDYQVL